jgi:LmbE family N-acetylglucosaminyl deacetylase
MSAQTVLIVAAHPDDEALGCGGAIARHADAGDAVHILFVADGVGARGSDKTELTARMTAAKSAAKILGAREPRFLNLPDNRLDTVPLLDIVQSIEREADPLQASIIYTHHGGDLNVDHRVTHQAVMTAFRPLPGRPARSIFGFETLSATEWSTASTGDAFRPNHFIDIGAQLDRKLAALDAYAAEMRPAPHPRSPEVVRALAVVRGSAAGLAAAEAFTVLRTIER